jgi:peptidoglycan hydrolase CwlO-like protein
MNEELAILISVVVGISGILLGWIGHARITRKDAQADSADIATIKGDIKHIKEGVDNIKDDFRYQREEIKDLSDRVARVEESTKSAHKRIDELGG